MRCIGQEAQRGVLGALRLLPDTPHCKPRLPETPIGRHQMILTNRKMLYR
jgi:hypothetical protein